MADRQFLRLSDRWALAYDSLQWIIQRRGSFDKKQDAKRWESLSFISSNRDILILTLREKGAVIDPGKMEEVLALPYSFKEWIGERQNRSASGRWSGGVDVAAQSPNAVEIKGATARSRAGPVFGPSRAPAGAFSAFGKKASPIPRDLIAATLPEQQYQPEDGEDLLAIWALMAVRRSYNPNREKTSASPGSCS